MQPVRWRFAPSSSSARMEGIQRCAALPALRSAIWDRQSMCCGCGSHENRVIRKRSWRFNRGRILATAGRGDYWQCGLVIAKGASEELRRKGIDAFRGDIAEIAPFLTSRLGELKDWNDVRLLTVRIDRLRQWYRTGLLCIGDAAHAMSPVGGVAINLAIQDAVAAANILVGPLLTGRISRSSSRRRLKST